MYHPHFILIGDNTCLYMQCQVTSFNDVCYELVNIITVPPCIFVTTHPKVVTDHIPCLLHKVPFQFIRILKPHSWYTLGVLYSLKWVMLMHADVHNYDCFSIKI